GKSSGRKYTPTVAGSEFTASIGTDGSFNQVAVIERVDHFSKEGSFTDFTIVGVGVVHDFRTGYYVELVFLLAKIALIVYVGACGDLTDANSLFCTHCISPSGNGFAIAIKEFKGLPFVLIGRFINHIRHVSVYAKVVVYIITRS